jgi:chemotaxis protein methyltransferase CheR
MVRLGCEEQGAMNLLSADIERFRHAIGRRLGLHFDDGRLHFLTEILEERLGSAGSTAHAYLSKLEAGQGAAEELSVLAERLTVGETYFFRNNEQLEAFEEVALPSRMQARMDERTLRVLSAGCASGEEPFSLAMLLRARLPGVSGWEVEMIGVDLDRSAIARARRARYSPWSLRETPEEVRRRWFRAEGREFALDEAVRSSVLLEERNLTVEDPTFWSPESYDIIFFRNVVMYFTTEQAQAVIARIERALAPGGFLFLGHAETLRGLSNGFTLCHSHGTFYYQRRGGRPIVRQGRLACGRAGQAVGRLARGLAGGLDQLGRIDLPRQREDPRPG